MMRYGYLVSVCIVLVIGAFLLPSNSQQSAARADTSAQDAKRDDAKQNFANSNT